MSPALVRPLITAIGLWLVCLECSAQARIANSEDGVLTLVAQDSVNLLEVDGLAFNSGGRLFAALEINGPTGGLVYIDKSDGDVVRLLSDIPRADQLAFDPSGNLYISSEINPGATSQRIYRATVQYGADGIPIGATASPVTTSLAVDNPEGVVVLDQASVYGPIGDLVVAEDIASGRLLQITPAGNSSVLVDAGAGLARPEGLAFGDFGGALAPALYVAETGKDRILRIDADGGISVLGNPASVGLDAPDNIEFGWDGYLYVTEDKSSGRVLRIAADGTHSVVATGFYYPQGLAFDPSTGHLYIGEQGVATVHRIQWSTAYRQAHLSVQLYDDGAGTPPDGQPWLIYASDGLLTGGVASRTVSTGGVELLTDASVSAGFSNYIPNPFDLSSSTLKNAAFPALDRAAGYELRFQLQLTAESHLAAERAGYSLTVISQDLLGVEIGFWEDEIWVQSGPDFNHAEGASFDTTAKEITYRLAVANNSYTLYADGSSILNGQLRNYASFGAPYNLPDFVYLGDNTSRAGASSVLGKVAVWGIGNVPVILPPTITSAPSTSAEVDTPYSYDTNNTVEADGTAPLTFSLISGPAGMTVSAAGLVTWTPSPAQEGDQAV
jgi:sugar lactone lactonase YvrE